MLTRNLVQYVNRMLVGALINSLVHYSLSYSLIDVLYYYDYDKSVSHGKPGKRGIPECTRGNTCNHIMKMKFVQIIHTHHGIAGLPDCFALQLYNKDGCKKNKTKMPVVLF